MPVSRPIGRRASKSVVHREIGPETPYHPDTQINGLSWRQGARLRRHMHRRPTPWRTASGHQSDKASIQRCMKILIDFFPILLFFGAYKFYDIYAATGVLMAATVVQTAIMSVSYTHLTLPTSDLV